MMMRTRWIRAQVIHWFDFGLKKVFKSVYRKRFNRNKQCCAHVCVMNIILHTLLLVDVCENINTIYIQLYTAKKSY